MKTELLAAETVVGSVETFALTHREISSMVSRHHDIMKEGQ